MSRTPVAELRSASITPAARAFRSTLEATWAAGELHAYRPSGLTGGQRYSLCYQRLTGPSAGRWADAAPGTRCAACEEWLAETLANYRCQSCRCHLPTPTGVCPTCRREKDRADYWAALNRAQQVESAIPGLRFNRRPLGLPNIGGVCPMQGWGTYYGQEFYFRFRHDLASIDVTDWFGWQWSAANAEVTGDSLASSLDTDELIPVLADLFTRLARATRDNPTIVDLLDRQVDSVLATQTP
jgi:hypothetical protein